MNKGPRRAFVRGSGQPFGVLMPPLREGRHEHTNQFASLFMCGLCPQPFQTAAPRCRRIDISEGVMVLLAIKSALPSTSSSSARLGVPIVGVPFLVILGLFAGLLADFANALPLLFGFSPRPSKFLPPHRAASESASSCRSI